MDAELIKVELTKDELTLIKCALEALDNAYEAIWEGVFENAGWGVIRDKAPAISDLQEKIEDFI